MEMQDREVQDREWENPENWSHPVFGLYFSKRDSRVWVPKRVPSFGWTLNLARPQSFWWLTAIIAIPALLGALIGGSGRRRRRR